MRKGRVLIVMVAVLAMAGAAGAQIFAVTADKDSGDNYSGNIYQIDPYTPSIAAVATNGFGFRSAGSAVVGNFHYSERFNDGDVIVRVDLSNGTKVTFTKDYDEPGGTDGNFNMAASLDGTIWELKIGTTELYSLQFDEADKKVFRTLEYTLPLAMPQFGDIAWGPDGLLYIATNNAVGNYVWDPGNGGGLTSFGNTGNYNGLAWYEGRLYGSLNVGVAAADGGALYELNPSDMSKLGDAIITSPNYRLNDLASWPLEEPCETDLIAGGGGDSGEIVGTVSVVNNGDGTFNVTYQTFGSWEITEVHFDAACDPSEFPTAGKGNPIPGQFCYTDYPPEGSQSFTISEPVSAEDCQGTPCSDTCAFYAAHAVVVNTADCDPLTLECRTETAWGDGQDFPGRNWATYFFCNCD